MMFWPNFEQNTSKYKPEAFTRTLTATGSLTLRTQTDGAWERDAEPIVWT